MLKHTFTNNVSSTHKYNANDNSDQKTWNNHKNRKSYYQGIAWKGSWEVSIERYNNFEKRCWIIVK